MIISIDVEKHLTKFSHDVNFQQITNRRELPQSGKGRLCQIQANIILRCKRLNTLIS